MAGTVSGAEKFPHGARYAYGFHFLNSVSFSIVMGAPIVLYVKSMGASATVVGLLAGLVPFFDILQIPFSGYINKVGYRKMFLWGWSRRNFLILAVAAVALIPAGSITADWRLALVLGCLAIYSILRGMSIAALLPWYAQWVPEERRGGFLAMTQLYWNAGTLMAMLLNALLLEWIGPRAFPAIFTLAFLAGYLSIRFMRCVPDVPVVEKPVREHAFWDIRISRPFVRLLAFNFLMNLGISAGAVFWVVFYREALGIAPSEILVLSALINAAAIVILGLLGAWTDHFGSRPMLALAGILFFWHFVGIAALAAGVIGHSLAILGVLTFLFGLGTSLYSLANNRLAILSAPPEERSFYLAVFSVSNSLTLALMPVFWGVLLDLLENWKEHTGNWEWNPYSVLYALLAIATVAALYALRWIVEPRAQSFASMIQSLFIEKPARFLSSFLAD